MENIAELNNKLRKLADENGVCSKFRDDWKEDWSLDKMAEQFYHGIDFFIDKRFMSNEFIKEKFELNFRREKGVLVDDTYSILNKKHSILIGKSKSTLRFNTYNVGTVYVLDDSFAKIIAKDGAFVMIHLYGSAQVNIEQKDKAHVAVIIHSKDCVVISDDNITIRREEK